MCALHHERSKKPAYTKFHYFDSDCVCSHGFAPACEQTVRPLHSNIIVSKLKYFHNLIYIHHEIENKSIRPYLQYIAHQLKY